MTVAPGTATPPPRARAGRRGRRLWAVAALGGLLAGGTWFAARPADAIPTATATRGDLVDAIELRGEIRPVRSVLVTAPTQSGELQIVDLLATGTTVQEGDLLVRFDDTAMRRTVAETASELEQAEAAIEQARAQGRIAGEERLTGLLTARYDVERARLDLVSEDFLARLDAERARLALADAEQRLRSAELSVEAGRAATRADIDRRERHRDKVAADLDRARRALTALDVRAPAAGTIHLLPNPNSGAPGRGGQPFRQGDRAWPGAAVAELPDLTQVRLETRLDESQRGAVRRGQRATIRVDAIPDREFDAAVAEVSLLARIDFASGWPPQRNFDLRLTLDDPEARLRPGMSATARLETERHEDVLTVPPDAIFTTGGSPVVYRRANGAFEAVPVQVVSRTPAAVAVSGRLAAGDRVATRQPPAERVISR